MQISTINSPAIPLSNGVRRQEKVTGPVVEKAAEVIPQAQSNATNAPTLVSAISTLNTVLSAADLPKESNPYEALRTGIRTSTTYRFKEDVEFTISDSNSHQVLSASLSDHTESVTLSLAGNRDYSAEELAQEINRQIEKQRPTRRLGVFAEVSEGSLSINSSELGSSAQIRVTGNQEFQRFFNVKELSATGNGGTSSYTVSANRLSEGRTATSGGNRVALRYWSDDAKFQDFKVLTPAIPEGTNLTGDEILGMYNKAFSEQIEGRLSARFNENGQIVFESAKTGSDSGFRIIRLPGNFSFGSNSDSSGYATRGTGGKAASLHLQSADSFGVVTLPDRIKFRVTSESGAKSAWIQLGQKNKVSVLTKDDLVREMSKAKLERTGVQFGFTSDSRLQFQSSLADAGFRLTGSSRLMNQRLIQWLGFTV